MRAELPWNVAGIPPEAREAARAAARREGLSVGEWLTRRILRSFSDLGEEPVPLERSSYGGPAPTYSGGAPLDAWGLPQSTAARRDSEEMLARVSRSEVESNESWRRIEDQLRGVSRRLDSSERSQSENNRVLSKTAAEVNVAAREQAQIFDQIGQNIGAINERLERLEHDRATDGVRDAVKALHQGLSRLADQIGQTANQSAAQVTLLTQNLEQLVHRMGQAREDAEHADKQLEQQIAQVAQRVGQVDQRLAKFDQRVAQDAEHADKQLEQHVTLLDQRITQVAQHAAQVEQHVAQVGQLIAQVDQRTAQFEQHVTQHVTAVDQKVAQVDQRSSLVEQHVTKVDQQVAQVHHQVAQVEQHVTKVDQQVAQVDHQLVQVEQHVTEVGQKVALVDQHVALVDQHVGKVDQLIAQVDQRVVQVEKSAQFTTNAVDHALEKLEVQANQRASDQVEWQRRAGITEETILRLEDSVAQLERASNDPVMERRLDSIEHSVAGTIARLETYNPAAPIEEGMHALSRRLELLEKRHNDLLDEMRANLVNGPQLAEPVFAPQKSFEDSFETPPFAQTPDSFANASFAEPNPGDPDTMSFLPPYGVDAFSPDAFATGQFVPAQGENEDPFAPLEGMVEPEGHEENFLSAARRSARAASEKSDAEKIGRFRLFRSRAPAADGETRKSKLLMPIAVASAVALLAVAAALVSQRLRHSDVTSKTVTIDQSAPPAADNRPFEPAPLVGTPPAGNSAQHVNSPTQQDSQSEQRAAPAAQQAASPQVVSPRLAAAQQRPAGATPTLDQAVQLANAGNPIAQTFLGLRALDGTSGASVNLPDALTWLTKAAAQGQAVAQYRLGTMYEQGQGVPANPATAAHWYQLAADQGNRKAMHNLAGVLYHSALGKPNLPEAARWFAKAAGLGLVDSQYNLAILYERGEGVPQSLINAYEWYAIAAASGDAGAKQRMTTLQTTLSDGDKAAAQKSASNFRPAPLARATNVPPELADLPAN
jgi:localization factor PodJL